MKSRLYCFAFGVTFLLLFNTGSVGQVMAQSALADDEVLKAEIVEITEESIDEYDQSQVQVDQVLLVRFLDGSKKGEEGEVIHNRMLSTGEQPYKIGDKVLVNYASDGEGNELYYVIDFVRDEVLFTLFAIFIIAVLAVSRWHGLRSLIGLAISFVIIFKLLLPGILNGTDPVLVTIVSAVLIILVTYYITHGFNEKTTWAVVGTSIALLVTGLLAKLVVGEAQLTGFGAEEAAFLQFLKEGTLNIQGLLLAGIIIGALGVLDDITISQSSVVKELKQAHPKFTTGELFARSMNVGRDHIASLVNTLILVYTGAALPLLLMFMLDPSRSYGVVVNYAIVAEEIARILIGSIGIVLAVPLTTFIASQWGYRRIKHRK